MGVAYFTELGITYKGSMKVTVHDILVNCSEHGKVPYQAISDLCGDAVTMQCPRCEEEAISYFKTGRNKANEALAVHVNAKALE